VGVGKNINQYLTLATPHVPFLFMSDAAAFSDAMPDPATDRTERHLCLLQELAELGMTMARAVVAQVVDAETPATDPGLAFSRIARAVRQTVALEARLAEDRQLRREKAAARDVEAGRLRAVRRKHEVRRCVEQAIEADASENDAEDLLGDLDERLDDGVYDFDFAERPVGELIARICRDLGVTPDWSLWEDEDWALKAATSDPSASRDVFSSSVGGGGPRYAMEGEPSRRDPSGSSPPPPCGRSPSPSG
jgi:hypothetical protein